MKTPPKRRGSPESGVVVVESAIILIAFFVILFGIMEAGRFLSVQQVVTDATREGARFAVAPIAGTNLLPGVDDIPGVIDVVNDFLGSANLPLAATTDTCGSGVSGTTTVEVCQETEVRTEYTRVTVTTTYDAMIPIFNGLEIPVVGDVRMRNETSPL
jgi:Flp pilus assembly protein TadG